MKNSLHIEVWNKCLEIIRDNLPPTSYRTWFEPIVPLRLDGMDLTIQVPSMYFVEYLEEHFIELLKKTLRRTIGQGAKLSYETIMIQGNADSKQKTMSVPMQTKVNTTNKPIDMFISAEKSNEIKNPFIIPGLKKLNIDARLNQLYSFDNFIEGDCNKLARSAGLSIAANVGKTTPFNPLFIYSENGLGKTHLAHAIGLKVKEEHSDSKMVLYVDAQQFQQQFVNAVQANEVHDFINFYRVIDLLIIDDVHVFGQGNKLKTQEAFFYIFNYLHQNNKQLILTSDKAPSEINGIEQRLLSRFKWGLVTELKAPDYNTRLAILKRKIQVDGIKTNTQDGIKLGEDVLHYLAERVTTNVRELEGALFSLIAHSTFNKVDITVKLAQDQIDKHVKNHRKPLTIDAIQQVVCDFYKIPIVEIKSKTRKREIVQTRQVAMYFAKNLTKESLSTIGMQIGGKDHATVLHAFKTVKNLIDTDKRFRDDIKELEKIFKDK